MKCIKAIKPSKHAKIGDIKRVEDKYADSSVKDGYWQYVSKSEWKDATRKQKEEEVREVYPANVEGSPEFNEANSKNIKKSKNK